MASQEKAHAPNTTFFMMPIHLSMDINVYNFKSFCSLVRAQDASDLLKSGVDNEIIVGQTFSTNLISSCLMRK